MWRKVAITLGWTIVGYIALPAIWVFLTNCLQVNPRFLPKISDVATAWVGLNPSILVHMGATAVRFAIGFILGTVIGLGLALAMFRFRALDALLSPTIQSMRAVPAAAIVPFFLLWFGFSETGRYLLATVAVAFNVSVAARQILNTRSPVHEAFFQSIETPPWTLTFEYCLPLVLENILPTLRYSLALAIGAVTVSELLGSQVGLGYLIQTSRATFSLNLLFLAMILLGFLSIVADFVLCYFWKHIVYWRTKS